MNDESTNEESVNGAASTGLLRLPSVEECRRIFRAAAVLDAMMSPEWEFRYYSYNAAWYESEEMASMRDGEGSHYFAWFGPHGLMIKGFDHELVEAGKTNIGVSEVPGAVAEFLREPAFIGEETTFCLWRLPDESVWKSDKPYSEEDVRLLRLLTGGAEHYQEWASWYYETEVDLAAVKRVFAQEPITEELLRSFNEESTLEDLDEELEEIGYPRG